MENNFNKFRRAAFGGFNREDVISYIEKMKNEFFDYKKEVEITIEQLNSKIRELEDSYQATSEPLDNDFIVEDEYSGEEANPVSDINEATRILRSVTDELCRSLSDFMVKVTENNVITENTESYVEEEPEDIVDTVNIAEEPVNEASADDKVSSILKSTSSFSYTDSSEENSKAVNEEVKSEKKNILDVLGRASFLK